MAGRPRKMRRGSSPYRCSVLGFEIDSYARRAEDFLADLDREYYLHFSGQKDRFEVERVYDAYPELFSRQSVEALRGAEAPGGSGDGARRLAYLLHFAVDGYLGQATKAETAEIAQREARLEVEVGGEGLPYRSAPIAQANEEDRERRASLEAARNAVLAEQLNPLHLEAFERSRELVRELGWPSYRDAYAELRGVDLAALAEQAAGLLDATESAYAPIVDPELEPVVGARLGEIHRADVPRFFRAPALDGRFPAERLVDSFAQTMSGLGIELGSQRNVHLDTESRPSKSPRAFCAPVRVPGEVHLVVPRVGGRDDYAALFHEGGHTEHYANVDPALAFEFRQLGDNSVTESFAFLLEHLTEDREWLSARLGVEDPAPVASHARAVKLVMLRRYAAKIAYELELGATADLEAMPQRYAELLGGATRIEWPRVSWLADVDAGYYVACYLRAWALESRWRAHLRGRFGEGWFGEREAGEWLVGLWREGQRLSADELLAETLGEELDLRDLAAEFSPASSRPR